MQLISARLAGRCANGAERGQGTKTHALPWNGDANMLASWRALCGATPGARSAGWCERPELEVTCPKCAKKAAIAKATQS